MKTSKIQLLNNEPDEELLAISGSLKQYEINIDNFVKRAAEIFDREKRKKKRRRTTLKKSAKAKK